MAASKQRAPIKARKPVPAPTPATNNPGAPANHSPDAPAAEDPNSPKSSRFRWSTLLPLLISFLKKQGPKFVSAAVHSVILILLAIITFSGRDRERSVESVDSVTIDTSLNVREDIFESNSPWVENKPILRKPGGGPVREALDPKPGDPAPSDTVSSPFDGPYRSGNGTENGDVFAPGGTGKGSGLGIADGKGGGAGVGDGSADFYGVAVKAKRVLYVIDRSGSMRENDAMDHAKNELLESLEKLDRNMEFQVIFYNHMPAQLDFRQNGLVKATQSHMKRAREQIEKMFAMGGTNHVKALRKAIEMRPDVIYLLTDADGMASAEVEELTKLNQKNSRAGKTSTINVIHLHHSAFFQPNLTIQQLALNNKGTYHLLDTSAFTHEKKPKGEKGSDN